MKIGFDFSGTLADDMPGVYAASRRVVEELGVAMPPFDVWKASGCANTAEFLTRFRIPATLADFSPRLRAAWGCGRALPYDGVGSLLRELQAAGHRLFLVSCCWQDVLEGEVHALGWEGLFERVVGGLDNKRAALAALEPDVYVGDTVGDLRACADIAPFIAVGYGYAPPEQLRAAGAAEVAANVKEVAQRLRALS